MTSWTIKRLLEWCADDFRKRGASNPRLDAELLTAHALGVERVRLYIDFDRPLDDGELASVRALVERRRRLEPVAYILGHRAFYGRDFQVSPGVLIPRPDTETLVDRALERIAEMGEGDESQTTPRRVLDVGAGTGCIGLTLAAEREHLSVDLVDISDVALEVTRANAAALGIADRTTILRSDLDEGLPPEARYDLIVSNPPYIPTGVIRELMADVRDHEPHQALDGGDDGLEVYRRLIPRGLAKLVPGGTMLLEIGEGQDAEVTQLARDAGAASVASHRDLGGIVRVIEITK